MGIPIPIGMGMWFSTVESICGYPHMDLPIWIYPHGDSHRNPMGMGLSGSSLPTATLWRYDVTLSNLEGNGGNLPNFLSCWDIPQNYSHDKLEPLLDINTSIRTSKHINDATSYHDNLPMLPILSLNSSQWSFLFLTGRVLHTIWLWYMNFLFL